MRLPLEIIIKIFDFLLTKDLYEANLVSRDWNSIASPSLYKYPMLKTKKQLYVCLKNMTRKNQSYIQCLDLNYAHEYVTDRCFINNKDEFLLKYMTNLKYINLSKCTRLSPAVIFLLVKHNAHGLHTLVLASCKISNDVLKWIGQANQHQLKFLNLENTMIRPCKAIDTSNHLESMLVDNSRNTAQLRYINLSFCTWVSSQTIENIARGLPKLEYVVLQWCNQIKLRTIIMMAKQLQFLNTIDVQHIDTIHDRKQVLRIINNATLLKRILFTHKTISVEIAS